MSWESAIDVEIVVNMNNHSNYYSIKTFFELRTITIKTRLKRNWKKIDFALLQQYLKKVVSYEKNLISTSLHDNSKSEFDRQVKVFTKSLQKIIKVFTSWIRICSRFKSKFIEKCKKNSREIKKAKRIWQNNMQKNDWDNYKILKNKLNKTMKKIMKKQFRKKSIDDCESFDKILSGFESLDPSWIQLGSNLDPTKASWIQLRQLPAATRHFLCVWKY